VAGERRLHGDARGLLVTDLSDQDRVGVLAQDAPEPVGEVHDVAGHLHLRDPVELVLDGILDGDDVLGGIAHLVEGGVQGGGLARPGRPGTQQHAERRRDDVAVALGHVVGHAQVGQADERLRLVEEAQHGLLTVDGGHDRNADVDRAVVDGHAELAVLGATPFHDVERGHHLDPAGDRRTHTPGKIDGAGHGAVDAIPHPHGVLGGFDVDIGGALTDRLGDDPCDHLHDGRIVVDLEGLTGLVVGEDLVVAELERLDVLPSRLQDVVSLIELAFDVAEGADPERHLLPHMVGDRPDRLDVIGVGGHQLETVFVEAQREDLVFACELLGYELNHRGIGGLEAQVGQWYAELPTERRSEAHLVEDPVAHQHFPDSGTSRNDFGRDGLATIGRGFAGQTGRFGLGGLHQQGVLD
jgi:hypothetical protein